MSNKPGKKYLRKMRQRAEKKFTLQQRKRPSKVKVQNDEF